MAKTYPTVSGDTWDMISFKLYSNEYYVDQLMTVNPEQIFTTVFDAGSIIRVPQVLVPENISNAVYGNIIRYS